MNGFLKALSMTGSLNFKVAQPTREHMKNDVADYIRYYNLQRLHTANGDQSPINYENSLKNMSGKG